MSEAHAKISQLVIAGRTDELLKSVQQALDDGTVPADILDNALLPGMDVVGQRMKTGEMFIPEVLRSAKSMQAGLGLIMPLMSEGASKMLGTVVIGTVEGDMHDIGKNLVAMMLRGSGFNVIDLGTNVSPKGFAAAVGEKAPDILGMSALLTTTMPKMKATLDCLEEAGLRDRVKVIVGGAPVTRKFAAEIGADAYGHNAAHAVEESKELLAMARR
jgi:5-methyltetrahydrofolate--homocysteine methyltransferase